jgi:hypothetical protein
MTNFYYLYDGINFLMTRLILLIITEHFLIIGEVQKIIDYVKKYLVNTMY